MERVIELASKKRIGATSLIIGELTYLYFRIGKLISENKKYGSNFINLLSTSLKVDFPNATSFSPRNLARMRKFYETYRDLSNLPMPLAKLPLPFNCLLIDKIEDIVKMHIVKLMKN